jgi:hypothetical protein
MDSCGWIPQNWSEWGSAFQILQTFLLLFATIAATVALFYAKNQAREASRARELAAARVLFDEIGTDEIRRIRTWVLEEVKEDSIPLTIGPEQKGDIRRLAVAYDRVAYMIKFDLLPEKALFYFQRDDISQIWIKIEPIINEVRQRRPHYYDFFKCLAEKWLPRHHLDLGT